MSLTGQNIYFDVFFLIDIILAEQYFSKRCGCHALQVILSSQSQRRNRSKGIGSLNEYFFKGLKIILVLSVHGQIVLTFLACLDKEKNNCKVSACFFENTY
jgi:hypothetical protein